MKDNSKMSTIIKSNFRSPFILGLLTLIWAASSSHAQSFQDSEFTVFSGYVNSDNYLDILMVPKKKFTLIAVDIVIPVQIKPPVSTFAIMSNSNGTYDIDASPSDSVVHDSAWQANTHELVFGDVLGNGEDEVLIRAMAPGSVSFLIALNSSDGALTILQNLSPTSVNVDLGTPGTVVELRDADGDGRVDLYIRVDGILNYLVLANSDGMFEFPDDDQGSVQLAWNTFRFALDDGDVASAIQQVMPYQHAKYEPALIAMGPNVTALSANWSAIKEIRTTESFAEYTIFETIGGVETMHIIMFQKEGDSWKLSEF